MEYQLKSRQICLFFLAFLPIIKLFTLPSMLAKICHEDMWICSVFNLLLDLTTLTFLILACKKTRCSFYTLLEKSFGKIGSKVILALYFIMFMLKAIIPINEQRDYVEFTLYTLMPTTYYFIPFFVLAIYFCTKKLRVLGRISDIMWLPTILGFLTLFLLSINNADISAILPIGARGISASLTGSYKSLTWFGDCAYMLFFIGEFSYQKKDGIKIVLSYLLGAIMVIVFMVIFYSIFTSIAPFKRFALPEISKYTTVINSTGRFDYIGIILLLLSNAFSLVIPLFFAVNILNKIVGFKKKFISPIIVVLIHLYITIFLNSYFYSIENFITNYCGFFFLILSNVLPIFTTFLVKKERKLEGKF